MKREIRDILKKIGENPDREGLRNTPSRVEKSLRFLTQGYQMDVKEVIGEAVFNEDINELVLVKDIELYSLCEHHLLPFFGSIHIGYIPNGRVIGLSKVARIADVFARRLQVQERLTKEIADALVTHLQPLAVGVIVEVEHLCMMMRGVQKQHSRTVTSAMRGIFLDCEFRNSVSV